MVTVLSRFFIKNYEQVNEPAVRRQYGVLCGGVGIALNILLFFGKFFAGMLLFKQRSPCSGIMTPKSSF